MRILLPVDGSPYTKRAIAFLGAHDDIFGAADELTLLHVVEKLPSRARAVIDKATLDRRSQAETAAATRAALAFFGRKRWNARIASRSGEPGEEIAAFAAAGRYHMIVMGTHGRGAVGSLLMGSTAQRVIAGCRVPVLLIR
jgi:nucleotide-binding universal stress UspA family protein